MAGSSQIRFTDDMIGDPNDLDDLIEATGRDISDISGGEDQGQRGSDREDDGQRSGGEQRSGDEQKSDNDGEKKKDDKSDDQPKKKRVLAPRVNLNPQRLKGPRGLTALVKEFETFKFRGKGHEREDLERVLARMEHWAHRLHPKLHFEDFITKAEKLCTKKKEMQVYMKRLRMGLETPDEEIVHEEEEEEAPISAQNEALNEFDRLLDDQISYYDDNPRQAVKTPQTPSTLPPSPAFIPMKASTLTADQKELIARKKKEAMEKRLARLRELEEQHLQEATAASLATEAEETSNQVASSEPADVPSASVPSTNADLSDEKRERAARNKQLALERLRARRLAAQGIQPDLNVSSTSDLAVPLSPTNSLASPKASISRSSPVNSPRSSSLFKEKPGGSADKCHENSPEKPVSHDHPRNPERMDEANDESPSDNQEDAASLSERNDKSDAVIQPEKILSQPGLSTTEKSGQSKDDASPKDGHLETSASVSEKMDDTGVSSEEKQLDGNLPSKEDSASALEEMDDTDVTSPEKQQSKGNLPSNSENLDEINENAFNQDHQMKSATVSEKMDETSDEVSFEKHQSQKDLPSTPEKMDDTDE